MEFFLDTAVVDEVKSFAKTGLIDGVTTNPSLIAKSGRDFRQVITEMSHLVSGQVSAEVMSNGFDAMVSEGLELSKIAKNICIKLPLNQDGLAVCKALSEKGIMTNVTLCFSANQALLAAKAGATYISPFIGRLDDISHDGSDLLASIREIYDNFGFETKILAASVRGPMHVLRAAQIGCDAVTMPASVFKALYDHPLTTKGLETFSRDWSAATKSGS